MKLTPLGDKVVLKAIKEEEKTKSGIILTGKDCQRYCTAGSG